MQNDEQAIRELVATWISASQVGDIETVLGLMADDVVFLVAGQPPMRGKVAFAEAAQAGRQAFQMEGKSDIMEVKILGEWAYVCTHLSIVITPLDGGESVKRAGNTMSILQKQEGGWVIVRDANMLVVTPSE